MEDITRKFRLDGRTAVLTGGGGFLCGAMAKGLGLAGAKVALGDIRLELAQKAADGLKEQGIDARAYEMNVLEKDSLKKSREDILSDFGSIDILVNGAGGNQKGATTSEEQSFFDLPDDAMRKVVDLNFFGGAVFPSQVFGETMAKNENGGSVINVSSMAAFRPLTRTIGYSAAKAAVSNVTMWLAVHFAQEYSSKLRVNALAPGFFLTEQNRFLLFDGDNMTPRGQSIIDHTPAACFGDPEDLIGATLWLASDTARFVTGIVLPVDGGFSAFCGV